MDGTTGGAGRSRISGAALKNDCHCFVSFSRISVFIVFFLRMARKVRTRNTIAMATISSMAAVLNLVLRVGAGAESMTDGSEAAGAVGVGVGCRDMYVFTSVI
jgi:hypothetical protein